MGYYFSASSKWQGAGGWSLSEDPADLACGPYSEGTDYKDAVLAVTDFVKAEKRARGIPE